MNVAAKIIYFGGQSSFRYKGVLYIFTDESQAQILNESIESFKKNKVWPGKYISISRLDKPGLSTKVSDAELAEVVWKGFKPSYETIFVTVAAIGLFLGILIFLLK